MNKQFYAKLDALLLAFNREAVPYCRSISDMVAQEYARNYARMIQNRANPDISPIPVKS